LRLIILLLIFISFNAKAEEQPWHMISFGRNGLGWAGTAEELETKSNSQFKSVDYFLSDISINYAFRISRWFQIGGFYQGSHSEYNFKKRTGESAPLQIESNSVGTFVIYNFSEDLNDSFYVGYSFAITSYEEENSHEFSNAEGKAPFELDDITQTHELIIGKRFSLRGFNVENLAYSPQFRIFYRTHGKDFDDQDVGSGTGLNVQPLRFDLLF
jgi:hypothetical protein